jgi:hypothetical protein
MTIQPGYNTATGATKVARLSHFLGALVEDQASFGTTAASRPTSEQEKNCGSLIGVKPVFQERGHVSDPLVEYAFHMARYIPCGFRRLR